MLSSHRTAYGLRICGLKKVMAWPRKVPAPFDEPEGGCIPLGNGSESVAVYGGTKLAVVANWVVWLKPSWFGGARRIGSTRMPPPPRKTVLLPSAAGVQANPNRGLKMEDSV